MADLTYFLRIDGVTGNSTDPDHGRESGWFQIDSYDLSQTGGSLAKPVFSPLLVDFHDLPAEMIPVLKGAVQGKHFNEIEIDVVDGGEHPFDIKLSNALITGFVQKGDGFAGVTPLDTAMAFSFTKISEDVDSNENIEHYIVTKNLKVDDPNFNDLMAMLDIPATAETFKLHVDQVNGDALEPFAGWFDIDNFSFGEILKGGGGGGGSKGGGSSGKPAFSDLHIDFQGHPHGLAKLFDLSSTGKHIKDMELSIGKFLSNDAVTVPVYDLKLQNVLIEKHHQKNGDVDMTFSFTKLSLTISSLDNDSGVESQTFTYDLKSGKTAKQHKALSDLGDLTFDDGHKVGDGHKHASHRESVALDHHGRFDAVDHHGHGGLFDL